MARLPPTPGITMARAGAAAALPASQPAQRRQAHGFAIELGHRVEQAIPEVLGCGAVGEQVIERHRTEHFGG